VADMTQAPRRRALRLAGLAGAAVAAGALLTPSSAFADTTCGAGQQPTATAGGATLTITSIQARKPGESTWEDAAPNLCVSIFGDTSPLPANIDPDTTNRYASFSFQRNNGGTPGSPDLAPEYPAGTRFSIAAATAGGGPIMTLGRFDRPRAAITDTEIVLQGESVPFRAPVTTGTPPDVTVDCDAGTTHASSLSGIVLLDPSGDGWVAQRTRAQRGVVFGTDAYAFGTPTSGEVDGNKVLAIHVTGCGDGDPATEDGFFTGFLPTNAVVAMGLDPAVLVAAPEAAFEHLMLLTSDGAPLGGGFTSPATLDDTAIEADGVVAAGTGGTTRNGVLLDDRLSYSAHQLNAGVRQTAATEAAACLTRGGEILASGSGIDCSVALGETPSGAPGTGATGGSPTPPSRPETPAPTVIASPAGPAIVTTTPPAPPAERPAGAPAGRALATVGGIQLIAGSASGTKGQAAPQMATVSRSGRMTVSLGTLYAASGARVVARVRVPLAAKARDGRQRRGVPAPRSARSTSKVTLGAGESAPLAVRLDRSTTRRVPRGRVVRVRVELSVTPTGGTTVRTTRTFRVAVGGSAARGHQ